jgi:multiple antibiotic resistance protein
MNYFIPYLLSFIPIFVAVNVLGILPIFFALTEGFEKRKKERIIKSAILTASLIALSFMFIGKGVFMVMGISVSDFKIGGGILLLVLSVNLLLPGESRSKESIEDTGIVPLGTPLITGPAVLTTTLVMIESYGILPTITSFILNILLVWFIFSKADLVIRLIGVNGSRAISKVSDILLAAIAIMLIREGIIEIIKSA